MSESPIFDATQAAQQTPTVQTPRLEEPQPTEAPDTTPESNDAEDVPTVSAEHTGDGPGDLSNLPESDFEGFPEPDVQKEDSE